MIKTSTGMMKRFVFPGLVLAGLAGCASQQQMLDKRQAEAVETAVKRARFEMACPETKGQVLSRTFIEPPFNGAARGVTGVDLVEYTVGVDGCGKRMTQVVACAVDATGCFSAPGRP